MNDAIKTDQVTAPKLTEAQRAALALWPAGRDFVFEADVCTSRIGKQLEGLGYVGRYVRRGAGGGVVLQLTPAGRAALRGES